MDGFGSCETVPIPDREEGSSNTTKMAVGFLAVVLVVGCGAYYNGSFDPAPGVSGGPGPSYTPTQGRTPVTDLSQGTGSPAAASGPSVEKLRQERLRLKKINASIKKRATRMRAQIVDMKNRDKAMQAREEEVEDKLQKAAEKLATAREMAEKGLDVEAETTRLMLCKSQKKELESEVRKVSVDRKRDKMREALKNAHSTNMKASALDEQKMQAIEMQETAEIDNMKKDLLEEKESLKSLASIQRKFMNLNKKKKAEMEVEAKELKKEKSKAKFMQKRLKFELEKLAKAQLVKLSEVYRLLGSDAGDLLKEQNTVVSHLTFATTKSTTLDVESCDREWCGHARAEFGVMDGQHWGRADDNVKKDWMAHKCHDKRLQDNTGCESVQPSSSSAGASASGGDPSMPPPAAMSTDPPPSSSAPPSTAATPPGATQPPVVKPGCDETWCNTMKEYYHVEDGKTWGEAPETIQKEWFTHHCHNPQLQINAGCAHKMLPGQEAGGFGGFEKPSSYEANAGAMGGSGTELNTPTSAAEVNELFSRRPAPGRR